MSRVRLNIDRLVLRGVPPEQHKAVAEGLQRELSRLLGDRAARQDWARSHRTPVLKLGGMQLGPGFAGARKFGADLGKRIGKGFKP